MELSHLPLLETFVLLVHGEGLLSWWCCWWCSWCLWWRSAYWKVTTMTMIVVMRLPVVDTRRWPIPLGCPSLDRLCLGFCSTVISICHLLGKFVTGCVWQGTEDKKLLQPGRSGQGKLLKSQVRSSLDFVVNIFRFHSISEHLPLCQSQWAVTDEWTIMGLCGNFSHLASLCLDRVTDSAG